MLYEFQSQNRNWIRLSYARPSTISDIFSLRMVIMEIRMTGRKTFQLVFPLFAPSSSSHMDHTFCAHSTLLFSTLLESLALRENDFVYLPDWNLDFDRGSQRHLEEPFEMEPNVLYFVRYKPIKNFVEEGKIDLYWPTLFQFPTIQGKWASGRVLYHSRPSPLDILVTSVWRLTKLLRNCEMWM